MPPALAAIITAGIIAALFKREARLQTQSLALWIPVAWLLAAGTRFISQWLTLGSVVERQVEDGSPIDAVFFLFCIVASIVVLIRRRVRIGALISNNAWLAAFLAFGLVSVFWSDFPFISIKRWVKVLGNPLVVLVILTDANPRQAFITVMKRCAYVVLPMSVLFIKYYPEFGRGFDSWTGAPINRGVGLNKNYLGNLCLVFGMFFFWYMLVARKFEDQKMKVSERNISIFFFLIAIWLLQMADSATSLAALIVGMMTILALGSPIINKKYVGTYLIVGAIIALTLELGFDARAKIIALLGRDATLTDRTLVWADVLALQPNKLLGAGFETFWMGERLNILWEKWWWKPNQAHNGYIETYLNLGLIGVFLLAGLLISTFRKICKSLIEDVDYGRWRLAMLLAICLFNYTEATFKGVHFMFGIFCLIALEYRPIKREKTELRPPNPTSTVVHPSSESASARMRKR